MSIRPEEYLAACVLVLFAVFHVRGVHAFRFATNFLKAAAALYAVLGGVILVARARAHRTLAPADRARAVAVDVLGFLRDWAPMVVLLSAYENSLTLVVRLNPRLYDLALFRLDEQLFGFHPELWLQRFSSRTANDVMGFCYDSLYIYPVVAGVSEHLRWRRLEARAFLASFVLCGYVGFVGYLFVPAIGPRFYFGNIHSSVEQGFFYDLAAKLTDPATMGTWIPRNCFPSLHTGWAVVVLIFAWRRIRPLFWIVLAPLTGLIVSTMYLRFHYGIDVVMGFAAAFLVSALVPRLLVAWERWRDPASAAVSATDVLRGRRLALNVAIPAALLIASTAWVVGWADNSADRLDTSSIVAGAILAEPPPMTHRVEARFGRQTPSVELVGLNLEPAQPVLGSSARITLFWRCLAPLSGPWQPFVHLTDAAGRHANWDHDPVSGLHPIRAWKPGEIIRDEGWLDLPETLLPGEGAIWIGLWDLGSARLPLLDPGAGVDGKDNRVRAAAVTLGTGPGHR